MFGPRRGQGKGILKLADFGGAKTLQIYGQIMQICGKMM